ncbi:MAG TPA: polysaccharide biosynthesis tyrosine autokinase [Candidatus Eisenbacteria bacterium]|nr:polysaccharide biosynthesis tyrosine autokinase [Candidatus Eisenbacteria bacterium]
MLASQFDEVLVAEVRRMFRQRRRLIAACTLAGLLLAGLYLLIKAPQFEAGAQIEVRPAGSNSLGLDEMAAKLLSPAEATTQLQTAAQVLQSNAIALEVMQQLRMAERGDFAGRWRQDGSVPVEALPPEVRDHLLERFRHGLSVSVVPKTDIVAVRFKARNAELSAAVVNAIINSYTERKIRSSYDSAMQVSNWLSGQMDDLKNKATESQEKLAELQRTTGLIGADETSNIVTDKLKQLDEQLTTAQADRVVKEARYRIATSGNPELLATAAPDPTLQLLRAQEAELRLQYTQLSTKFGSGYPKLAEVTAQATKVDQAIDVELNKLSERYKNDYMAAANSEKLLRAAFEEQKQKAYDLNHGAAQYAILKHEVETTRDLYETLQRKLKEAGISAGLASANIGLVDAAQVPSQPVEPRAPVVLGLGLGAGLALGTLGAVVLEAMDTTIRSGEEAEALCAVPSLATIPRIGEDAHASLFWPHVVENEHEWNVIAAKQPYSKAAESYRTLRSSLLLGTGGDAKVLVVTSALPAEGKTLTAVNCATVLAQQGSKVLLVDADLRRSSLHRNFGIRREPGLGDVLNGRCAANEAVVEVDNIPHLSVVSSGMTLEYPAEALASEEMTAALRGWREQYDHVVIDTPPVAMVTDAVVLAAQADAVLLVAMASETTKQALLRTRDRLLRANARIAGVVVNGVDARYESSYYRAYGRSEDETGYEPRLTS